MSSNLNSQYDELLQSDFLKSDSETLSNLMAFRERHIVLAQAIEKHLPSSERQSIADIGCHSGFFLRLSSEIGFKTLYAVDYHKVDDARSFLANIPGSSWVKANFNERNFLKLIPDASVNCVSSTEVFEHVLFHPFGYLEECWRIIKPGGLLLFSTPNPANFQNAVRLIRGKSTIWGDDTFAMNPKVNQDGEAIASWDIHYREYPKPVMAKIFTNLPNSKLLEHGFLANRPTQRESALKRASKLLVWGVGLGHSRLFSPTQYAVLKKLS